MYFKHVSTSATIVETDNNNDNNNWQQLYNFLFVRDYGTYKVYFQSTLQVDNIVIPTADVLKKQEIKNEITI